MNGPGKPLELFILKVIDTLSELKYFFLKYFFIYHIFCFNYIMELFTKCPMMYCDVNVEFVTNRLKIFDFKFYLV